MQVELDFGVFRDAVAKQFEKMQKHGLYRVDLEKDKVWEAYLDAWPEGTNEMYRERREHDCACCRNFVRAIGNAVAVIDNKIVSVWDIVHTAEAAYNTVADRMAAFVKSASIADVFLHGESRAGASESIEDLFETAKRRGEVAKGQRTRTWTHFFANIKSQFVTDEDSIPAKLAVPRDNCQVLKRAMEEFTMEGIDTVLDMIAAGSLYKGEEFKGLVDAVRAVKVNYDKLETDEARQIFLWAQANTQHQALCRIRNASIGKLVSDLSTGVELEDAVKMYESKVAPTNYKRTTALVTPQMVAKAQETIKALGRESALHRRRATLRDITVNDILFADRNARKRMGDGDVFADLASSVTRVNSKSLDRIEEVPIDRFLSDVLPRATAVEVLLENKHEGNLVSLVAPVDPTAGHLFKWANNFSWAYNGDVTDAIKERVKAAGGAVDGDLCCRLSWEYTDDLDFHMLEPNGHRIYFANRRQRSRCGGVLDLDANGADGQRSDPAENIVYADRRTMMEGEYKLIVHNYSRRSGGTGFEVEIEFDGERHNFVYDRVVRNGEYVDVATIKYSKAKGFEVIGAFKSQQASKLMWGLQTQQFHKVNVAMLSPNHWEGSGGIGNKHYFFMLDGCKSDVAARGFFNEFMAEELTPHRKVFEALGNKMKAAESDEQLSGLGFSSTKRASVVLRVTGVSSVSTLRVMI